MSHHALILSGTDPDALIRSGLEHLAEALGTEHVEAHPDFLQATPNERGVITIDAVRELSKRLTLMASKASLHGVLIPAADRMTASAQNALLKTLEEPPSPTRFVLLTQRYRSLLPTVRSRCIRQQVKGEVGDWAAGDERIAAMVAIAASEDGSEDPSPASAMAEDLMAVAAGKLDPIEAAGRWGKEGAPGLKRLLESLVVDRLRKNELPRPEKIVDAIWASRRNEAYNPNALLELETLLLHWRQAHIA